jgi:hypothetical protein
MADIGLAISCLSGATVPVGIFQPALNGASEKIVRRLATLHGIRPIPGMR